jgi:hypothetical protein
MLRRVKRGDVRGAAEARKSDAVQVGYRFSKITAALVDSVSPHFVMVFCARDCEHLAAKLASIAAVKERLAKMTTMQTRYNNVCFMELFGGNMTRYILKDKPGDEVLRGLIFQVVYTLAALQKRIPGFRHNDLSTNNVLVKKLRRTLNLVYTTGSMGTVKGASPSTFLVPTRVFPALSDYDFVHAPSLKNERVLSGKFKVDGRPNDSYDTHLFLKSVLKCLQDRTDVPETRAFLRGLRMREQDRQNDDVLARLRPMALLRHRYFSKLRRPPSGNSAPMAGKDPAKTSQAQIQGMYAL